MNKSTLLFFLFIAISITSTAQNLYPDLFDQSGGITDDYGAWGDYDYAREASIDVVDKGTITFYHPVTALAQKPTIFFISGWGRTYDTYDKFFKYLASLGYSVVNIYNLSPGSIVNSYQNSLVMMQEAVVTYADWIDTSKVGLMGHSYGGGSTIWLGEQIFSEGLNWGSQGRFIMMFAPWYPFLVEDTDLQAYPSNVKLLILQSNDDYKTDPRILRAMYQLINIPDEDKDLISIFSDEEVAHEYEYEGTSFSYIANHYTSYTDLVDGNNNPYDALDVFSSNRLAHALTDYVFEGNLDAKTVALGNGSDVQKNMGIMPDLAVTDYYIEDRPESEFVYKCSEDDPASWGDPAIWKLHNYCSDANNDGIVDALTVASLEETSFTVFPVPTTDYLQIRFKTDFQSIQDLEVRDVTGKLVYKAVQPNSYHISTSKLVPGTYFVKIQTDTQVGVQAFIVK